MNAFLVGHLGRGDYIFMSSAAHFLLNFYDKIYFLCRKDNCSAIKSLFIDNPNIILVDIDFNYDGSGAYKYIQTIDKNIDIISCCMYKKFSRITNEKFLNYNAVNDNKYTLDLDTINNENYNFLSIFYNDIRLNLSYFFDYFHIPDTEESLNLYNSIKNYYIIFIQLKCSSGAKLNIDNLINKYINDPNVILICNDENLYNNDNKIKYDLAQQFILNEIVYYNDMIKNCNEIYMIESCFSSIVFAYSKTNKLKATNVRIIIRDLIDNYKF